MKSVESRVTLAATGLSLGLLLSGCTNSGSGEAKPQSNKSFGPVAPHQGPSGITPEQATVPFDAKNCARFALKLAAGETRPIKDIGGVDSGVLSNLGRIKNPQNQSGNLIQAIAFSDAATTLIAPVPNQMNEAFPSGLSIHLTQKELINDAVDVAGWVCGSSPTPASPPSPQTQTA